MVSKNNINEKMKDLSPEKISAIKLRLSGFKISEVADRIGKDRSTLWRWKNKDEDYKEVLNELKSKRTGEFITLLQRIHENNVLARTLEKAINENSDEAIIDALTNIN